MAQSLIRLGQNGLTGPGEVFHIDSWRAAAINLLTHAHSDHSRPGSGEYWCVSSCAPIVRQRLGPSIRIRTFEYGQKTKIGDCWISFHSAGHILGSAQIRVEKGSEVWVASGDYKRDDDPSCEPFEVVPCNTFITEATFALPIYKWESSVQTAKKILDWWNWCKSEDLTAILFCYALGKSQRVLAELNRLQSEPVYLHGAVDSLTKIYREQGIAMAPTFAVNESKDTDWAGKLIIAPPSAHRSVWMKRFKNVSTGFASGWMAVRGMRRQRGYERGFVLSDHADWDSLLRTIRETGCSRVLATHGSSDILSRYLREQMGLQADTLRTEFGESED